MKYNSLPEKYHNEISVLLLATRPNVDSIAIEEVLELIHKGFDWDYLIETAFSNNVHLLLFRALKNNFPELVPKHIFKKLKSFFNSNSTRSFLFFANLLHILKMLDVHEIKAIPFKGPVLAAMVYGGIDSGLVMLCIGGCKVA